MDYVTSTKIDDALYRLQMAAHRSYTAARELAFREWVLYAVNRYIQTGRASLDWLRAFVKADMNELMEYAAKLNGGSDDEIMLRVNRYLKKMGG